MKRLIVALCLGLVTTNLLAEGVSLDNDKKKFSYAVGLQIAQSLIRQGVEVDLDAFSLAIRDSLDGTKPRLTMEELEGALKAGEASINEGLKQRGVNNLKAGKDYRDKNKKAEGVVELSNGLQYKELRKGAGEHPKATDTVTVHYTGSLIDGREFDSSKRRGEAAKLNLSEVIKGWQEVIPLMTVGSRWQVVIPPELAYGAKGAGAVIGPNETLVFEIELLEINK